MGGRSTYVVGDDDWEGGEHRLGVGCVRRCVGLLLLVNVFGLMDLDS